MQISFNPPAIITLAILSILGTIFTRYSTNRKDSCIRITNSIFNLFTPSLLLLIWQLESQHFTSPSSASPAFILAHVIFLITVRFLSKFLSAAAFKRLHTLLFLFPKPTVIQMSNLSQMLLSRGLFLVAQFQISTFLVMSPN